jgi:hypothetical protein
MTSRILALLLCPFLFFPFLSPAQMLARVAGDSSGAPGYSGNGKLAQYAVLNYPSGMAHDKQGNLFVADLMNAVIRKIDRYGFVSVFAGTGEQGYSGDGGPALDAKLTFPTYLYIDNKGNLLFSDFQVIRKVDVRGIITTVAGCGEIGFAGDNGPATDAWFRNPTGIVQDKAGNVYIADSYNNRIRKVDGAGIITTCAGSGAGYSGDGGPATAALFLRPSDLAIDKSGNMFIADRDNNVIRKIDTGGIVTTVAGNGFGAGTAGGGWGGDGAAATDAMLSAPISINVDDSGALYFCEIRNNVVRKVDANGIIHTLAGTTDTGISASGTPASAAKLKAPFGICVENNREIYFTDRANHLIWKRFDETGPSFVHNNSAAIDICSDSSRYALGDALSVLDLDKMQGLKWSIISPPLHGDIVGSYESVGGDIRVPDSMYYLPYRTYRGTDSFTVRVSDGYYADSTVVRINALTDGEIICGPVPSSGDIQVRGVFGCNTQQLDIAVFNALGQRVFYQEIAAPNGVLNEELVLDRSLARGMYFLKIKGAGQYRVFRLLLE